VALTDRRQGAPLPNDRRWAYHACFSDPLQAWLAFGVSNTDELHRHIAEHGFRLVDVERLMRAPLACTEREN